MADENDGISGHVNFAKFHLEGKYENELFLFPVAVKTGLWRQHISKERIEYGFEKTKALEYKAVIVEGEPHELPQPGFFTARDCALKIKEIYRG